MMESFVNEGLVEYDYGSQDTTLTDAGRKFIEQKV
jgi:predicted transcriptional regulator